MTARFSNAPRVTRATAPTANGRCSRWSSDGGEDARVVPAVAVMWAIVKGEVHFKSTRLWDAAVAGLIEDFR
jgi:hypothetical protein